MMAGAHDDDSDTTAEAQVASIESLPHELLVKIFVSDSAREDLAAIAATSRTFKEALYCPVMIVWRATKCFVELSYSSDSKKSMKKPALREARKWWEICAELHPRDSREALTMVGILAYSGSDVCPREIWKLSPYDSPQDAERFLRNAIAAESQAPYVLLKDATYALNVARAELARVLVKRAGTAGDEQANAWLDEAGALVRGVLAHDAKLRGPVCVVHPQRTAAVVFAEIVIRRGPASSLSEALAFLDAVPDDDRDGTWLYAVGMVHKRLVESHRDEHAKATVRHICAAMAKGHTRAAYDVGVLSEEGLGASVNLTNAYLLYILGCRSRDERAIAKVRELRANMSAPFFVALGTAYDRGILSEARVRGNETLEDLREFYLMFEPPGNQP